MSESGYQFGICSVVKNESIYLRAKDLNAPPEEVKLYAYLESNGLTVFEQSSDEEKTDYGLIKEKIRADLKRYISKQTQTRPLIMPVILEICPPETQRT